MSCRPNESSITTTNVPWNKSIELVSVLPNDNLPQGRCALAGAYNGVSFEHNLATEDYVQ